MTTMKYFHEPITVLVIGANGGIGAALVDQLVADQRVATVHAGFRRPPERSPAAVTAHRIDTSNEASIAKLAAYFDDTPLDLVIVATGILHDSGALQPEKRMEDLSAEAMLQLFTTNTIGPTLVAKHFLPKLRPGYKTVFAALSARVGSISDNRLGGWTSYRASKAALNMTLKTLSVEQQRRRPDSVIAALHPGTVDTPLSKPFQGNVPENKLFTPAFAAESLLGVVDALQPSDSGGFFAWDGIKIDY